MILILLFDLLTFLLIFLLFFFIFSSGCLYSYYFTIIFQKLTFFVTLEYSCTFLVYYFCTPTWSIHILDRFIYYWLVYCCYCFNSYCFWIIMQKLTFFVTLELFWLLLFIVYILLVNTFWFLYFYLICSKTHFFRDTWVFLHFSGLLFLYSYLIYSYSS